MNDLDNDPYLGVALRERVKSEVPDLERLATASLSAGTRLRRRRRIGAAAGAVAGVAVIALATSQLGGGTTASDPSPAGEPTSSSSTPASLRVGDVLDLGNGVTGKVTRSKDGLYELGSSTLPGAGSGFVLVIEGPTAAVEKFWSDGFTTKAGGYLTEEWPGISVAVSQADATTLGMGGKVDKVPVTVGAGWSCEWTLEDNKAYCTSADGGVAGLVIRDASERDAWLGSPDKGNDPAVYTTEVHGDIFISVQTGQGTTNAEIQELGKSLVWVD